MRTILSFLLIATIAGVGPSAPLADQTSKKILVNGVALKHETIQTLEAYYRVTLQNGRFWYDNVSGLWGFEGGPALGQMMPALNLGGPLKPTASGGNTGVFINGQELHPVEVRYLQSIFGQVMPGRYWLNAQGVGGYEGGPPLFQLNASAYGGTTGRRYLKRTPGGTIGGDSNCFYYNHPNGSSVMNCN